MHDAVCIAQVVQDVRHMYILRARENIHTNPTTSQLAGKVADVNVHPARVFTSQGCQWASVVRDHSDSHTSIIP
jgi:hypothetical protein